MDHQVIKKDILKNFSQRILEKSFQKEPVAAFKCNKNLNDFIGSNKIKSSIAMKIKKLKIAELCATTNS